MDRQYANKVGRTSLISSHSLKHNPRPKRKKKKILLLLIPRVAFFSNLSYRTLNKNS